jgi:hypothetical protein
MDLGIQKSVDCRSNLTGIWLNDCDSILQRNIGVDLAVDELRLVQIFEALPQEHIRFMIPPSERPNSFQFDCQLLRSRYLVNMNFDWRRATKIIIHMANMSAG